MFGLRVYTDCILTVFLRLLHTEDSHTAIQLSVLLQDVQCPRSERISLLGVLGVSTVIL